jgi:beta-phosphoglucomutase-like phosphatase (HAD superfamily)
LAFFEGRIVSAYEVESWKPAPGLILAAAELLGLAPQRCLLVEDSIAGVSAGLAAGTQVAGYGEFDFSQFEGQPNFHRVEDYAALAELLQRLNAA